MGKLLFLARALDYGGAERQLVILAGRLHAAGHDVRLAVFYPGGGLDAELRAAGVPVHFLEKAGRWDVLGFFRNLIRHARAERPALVHGYLTVPNILAVALKPWVPGLRVVFGLRASNIDLRRYDWLSRLTAGIECRLSRRADLLIVNSWAGRDHHIAQGFPPEKLRVIPNGIDTARFRPDPAARQRVRESWGVNADEALVGLIARFDPMKDHPGFLQAAARLAASHPAARFVCLGGGDPAYRAGIETMAQNLGLGSRILFREPQADMPPVYAALDLLASSSAFGEGFSNVIGEAMAAGVPCAATDVGDSARIVGDAGRVVPPNDPAALAGALGELLDLSPEARAALGERARRRIEEQFSVEALVKATLAALESLE